MKKIIITIGLILLFFVIVLNINNKEKTFKINGSTFALSVNGTNVESIPSSGSYYLSNYFCKKGSILTWDRENNDLYIEGTNANTDNCYLEFNSNPLLNTMKVGDYVAYVGNNGCKNGGTAVTGSSNAESGNSCLGENANQPAGTTDTYGQYGYCSSSSYRYYVTGWRIAYIEDDKVYLTSAGSPECVSRPYEEKETGPFTLSSISISSSSSYYYSTTYSYDSSTGKFTLSGEKISGVWSSIYSDVLSKYKYTCKSTSETGTCSTLYELTGYINASSANGNAYYNFAGANSTHISLMNTKALKYCNPTYADGGSCPSDNSNTWAMGNTDFQKITYAISGTSMSLTSAYDSSNYCNSRFSRKTCGYNNDILDNGGYYWFSAYYTNDSTSSYYTNGMHWYPNTRRVSNNTDMYAFGFRPIIRLSSSVYVTGGKGTMDDPYTIGI